MWKDVLREECVDIPHKLIEEDILVVCKDFLKEECSNVPRTEYENITVDDTEDCWDNDMEATMGHA